MTWNPETDAVFETKNLTRKFGDTIALDSVSLASRGSAIVGLIGKNGSGKTTLLRHLAGIYLPTSGACTTLGTASHLLGREELSRIGVAHQKEKLLGWMSVAQLIRYISTFYESWDRDFEQKLVADFELDLGARVDTLSPGNAQRLSVLLALCHWPRLLLLDEPLSDLDPVGRDAVLDTLLHIYREREMTILISSHLLFDIERLVDHIVCLHRGRLVTDSPLDDLKERYAEWSVRSSNGALPLRFDESFVLEAESDGVQAKLTVRDAGDDLQMFIARYHAEVEVRPLNLPRLFPLLISDHVAPADSDAAATR